MLRRLVEKNLIGIFAVLRNVVPIFTFGKKIALVTRADDVSEVMANDDAFMVTYEPKMRVVAGGENFFLGMGDTPRYHRDVNNWRTVFPDDSVQTMVAPLVESTAVRIVDESAGELDVIEDLAAVVACTVVEQYMGVTGPTQPEMVNWASKLFGYLFYPSKPGPVEDEAARLATHARDWIDELIADRKSTGEERDDGMGRALKMQADGVEGMTDVDIRNNLLGIVIGAIPTTSKCVALVLDFLLDHPDHMRSAAAAARNGDWELMNGFVNECLRFNPFGPLLLRDCVKDQRIAKGKLRSRKIKAGTPVAVGTLSAMWDGRKVDHPKKFDPTRPADVYLTYGEGMHTCFGYQINTVQIGRIVGAILVKDDVTRGAGDAGTLQTDGQFPTHLRLTFSP